MSPAISRADMPTLAPGDISPSLKVGGWLKNGGPDIGAEAGHLRVVEFWATWCGPCKEAIPHLTELTSRYRGKVDIVGVSVWEQPTMSLDDLKAFVAAQGKKMDYHVAYDTADSTMAKTWLEPAGQHGIPTSFLLDSAGKILWIGYPTELDRQIDKALTGKFDVVATRSEFMTLAKQSEDASQIQKQIDLAASSYQKGDKSAAEELWKKLENSYPNTHYQVQQSRLSVYPIDSPEGQALVDKLMNESGDGQIFVAVKATNNAKSNPRSARVLLDRVVAASKDCIALYDAATGYLALGAFDVAVRTADTALALLEKDGRRQQLEEHGLKSAILKVRDRASSKLIEDQLPTIASKVEMQPVKAGTGNSQGAPIDEIQLKKLNELSATYNMVAIDTFPQILRTLQVSPPPTLKKISIVVTDSYDGVAATEQNEVSAVITVSAKYALSNPRDLGMVVHELTHVAQHYKLQEAGWLVEGIADWVRWYNYEWPNKRPEVGPETGTATSGYWITAAFLDWARVKYNDQLIVKLNADLAANRYSDEVFKTYTGYTLEQLNKEWLTYPKMKH